MQEERKEHDQMVVPSPTVNPTLDMCRIFGLLQAAKVFSVPATLPKVEMRIRVIFSNFSYTGRVDC